MEGGREGGREERTYPPPKILNKFDLRSYVTSTYKERQWQGRAGAWTSDMLGFGEDWRERLREVENQKED
jgi:hypothetical protein